MLHTNCYLVSSDNNCFVVDPGDDADLISRKIANKNLDFIFVTHCHMDHIGALYALKKKYDCDVFASEIDSPFIESALNADGKCTQHIDNAILLSLKQEFQNVKVDKKLKDKDVIDFCGEKFEVILTPGHTPGSICLYSSGQDILFAGDTLFDGGLYGRCDLMRGCEQDMIWTLKNAFVNIPDSCKIFCGHNTSSIFAKERILNQFLN
ncbi:MAG: MBL fold metallo-hydrolase [Coriobacteriales bacterium]|nr:MBL fold metallo-hydrolase [Coriobacteriales bacterium]